MKTDKTGDARGRPSWRSSFVGDPGATFSGGKRDPGAKLDAGGKDLFPSMQDMYHQGGSKDE
jgi:hypothetical protein